MKTIRFGYPRQRAEVLHIETPFGIINIYSNLKDKRGRKVLAVGIMPDGWRYAGDLPVVRRGDRLVQLRRAGKRARS